MRFFCWNNLTKSYLLIQPLKMDIKGAKFKFYFWKRWTGNYRKNFQEPVSVCALMKTGKRCWRQWIIITTGTCIPSLKRIPQCKIPDQVLFPPIRITEFNILERPLLSFFQPGFIERHGKV
jgi:hypothetical protein